MLRLPILSKSSVVVCGQLLPLTGGFVKTSPTVHDLTSGVSIFVEFAFTLLIFYCKCVGIRPKTC